jgi:hypothetical protein
MSMRISEGGNNAEVVRVWLLSRFQVCVGRRAIREDTWPLRKANAVVKLLVLALTAFGQRSLNLTTPGGSSDNGWLTHPAYAGSCNTASKRPKREE